MPRKLKTRNLGPVQTSFFCRAELNSGIKFDKSTAEARSMRTECTGSDTRSKAAWRSHKIPPHGMKTNPLMKTFHKLAMDIKGSQAKMKLATLNLKLASLRIQAAIGQRRRKLKENRVGKKTTLRIWWISFAIETQEENSVFRKQTYSNSISLACKR